MLLVILGPIAAMCTEAMAGLRQSTRRSGNLFRLRFSARAAHFAAPLLCRYCGPEAQSPKMRTARSASCPVALK